MKSKNPTSEKFQSYYSIYIQKAQTKSLIKNVFFFKLPNIIKELIYFPKLKEKQNKEEKKKSWNDLSAEHKIQMPFSYIKTLSASFCHFNISNSSIYDYS